jgi:hypothetical protein
MRLNVKMHSERITLKDSSLHLEDTPDFVRAPHPLGGSSVSPKAYRSIAEIPSIEGGATGSFNPIVNKSFFHPATHPPIEGRSLRFLIVRP